LPKSKRVSTNDGQTITYGESEQLQKRGEEGPRKRDGTVEKKKAFHPRENHIKREKKKKKGGKNDPCPKKSWGKLWDPHKGEFGDKIGKRDQREYSGAGKGGGDFGR